MMVRWHSAGALIPWKFPRAQRLMALIRGLLSNSLIWNSACIMATTLLTSALGYGYWIVAARTYSTHDVGLASAFLSAMQLTSTLANLGIGSYLIQTLPRRAAGRDWSRTVNAGIVTGAGTSILVGVVVVVLLPRLSPQFAVRDAGIIIAAFAVGVALTTLATVLDQVFVAERASGNMLIRNATFASLKIPLLVLPFALMRAGALGILLSWIVAAAASVTLGMLILIPRLGRQYLPGVRGIVSDIRTMRASLIGQHLINIGGVMPMYVIPILVTIRISATDSAYYYTTWMLGSVFFMISSSVATALFSEGAHAGDHLGRQARSSAKLIAALLAPMMIVFLLGGRFILAVFGPGYAQHSVFLLDILVIAAVPDAITNIYVSTLRVRRQLRAAALLNLGMATLALLLAWLLLPRLGIAGGGLAWMIGQTAGCGVVVVVALRGLGASRLSVRARRQAMALSGLSPHDMGVGALSGDHLPAHDARVAKDDTASIAIEVSVVLTRASDVREGDITLIRRRPILSKTTVPESMTVGIPAGATRIYRRDEGDLARSDLEDTLVRRAVRHDEPIQRKESERTCAS